jgi:hypothetical protein
MMINQDIVAIGTAIYNHATEEEIAAIHARVFTVPSPHRYAELSLVRLCVACRVADALAEVELGTSWIQVRSQYLKEIIGRESESDQQVWTEIEIRLLLAVSGGHVHGIG